MGPEGGLGSAPTPLVVLSAGCVQSTLLLLLAPPKVAVGVGLFVSCCSQLAPTIMHAIIFSLLEFPCILLLEAFV